MDALLIVDRIREAESLAGSGRHGAAIDLLNGLLGQPQLAESQRQLIQRKVEVLDKQKQRATRMMSAREARAPMPPLGIDTEVVPTIPDAPAGHGGTHRIPRLAEYSPEPGSRVHLDTTTDGYFGPRESARSGPELEQMARTLPADDPSRDLALEVLRLRGEVQRLGSGRIADTAPPRSETAPRDTGKATARARSPQRTPTPAAATPPPEPAQQAVQPRSNVIRIIGLVCAVAAGMALAGWVAHLLYSIFNA